MSSPWRAGWVRALCLGALLASAVSGCLVPEFTYDGEWPGSGGAGGDGDETGGSGPGDGGTDSGGNGGDGDGGTTSGGAGGGDTGGADTGGTGSGGADTGGTDGSGGNGGGSGGGSGGSGGGSGGEGSGGTTGETLVFLLYGQSNMWGILAPEAVDLVTNPRVEVLTLVSCAAHGADEWVTAAPPLHGCVGMPGVGSTGAGIGPGDYFARALAEAYPEDTILLVPGAVPGATIADLSPAQAPDGAAYRELVARAEMAQDLGEIRGILFHQGESNSGQATWPQAVADLVSALKSDLGIGNVPFLAGELAADGCCGSHNSLVAELPTLIPNAYVVPAADLPVFDAYHFDLPSQRTLGGRYADIMIDALAP